MRDISVLQWIFFFLTWISVLYLAGSEPLWRGARLFAIIVFTVSLASFGAMRYFEGRHEVIDCLQTNETEC